MRKWLFFWFLLIAISITFNQNASNIFAEPPSFSTSSKSSYSIDDHLAESVSIIQEVGKPVVEGQWQKDRFIFPGYGDHAQIRLTNNAFNAIPQKAIFFHALPNAVRRLRFHHVPPGSLLLLSYGIDDVSDVSEDASVYLRVLAGKNQIAMIRIPNQKGWYSQSMDLGPASFLRRSITLTFEITTDNLKGGRLNFTAEILLA